LGLFNYGYRLNRDLDENPKKLTEEHGIVEIKDRDLDKIIDNIVGHTVNYGAPLITIEEADGDTLVMKHHDKNKPLDKKYASKTLEYIYELWGSNVELETYNSDGEGLTYIFDESGLDIL